MNFQKSYKIPHIPGNCHKPVMRRRLNDDAPAFADNPDAQLFYSDLQARHLICWLIAIECVLALAYVVIHVLWPEST